MTRRARGFTLLELMVVVAIAGILGAIVVWSGRSVRKNASLSESAYQLTLRMSGLRARAMADATDYVLIVTDAQSAALCRQDVRSCGTWVILHAVPAVLDTTGFTGVPPFPAAMGEVSDNGTWDRDWDYLPRDTQFGTGGLAAGWRPEAPFDAVAAWDPRVVRACNGRPCFALRFRSTGEVGPEPAVDPAPAGFAFALAPADPDSAAREARGIFVSFPTGIVKTKAIQF